MNVPTKMMAAVLEKYNEPLVYKEISIPEMKPGDMLTKVLLASLCGTDVHLAHDELPFSPPLPLLMGHETVAEIVTLPEGVTTDVAGTPVKVGDRIMWAHHFDGSCYSCKVLQDPSSCTRSQGYGFHHYGGFAEYEVVYAGTDFVRIPDAVSNEEAVGCCCAGRTAVSGFEKLANCGGIRIGDSVCVTGAGPVGLYCVVLAAASGASKIIATDPSKERLAFAKRWGATDIVDPFEHPDPKERVEYIRSLCGGRGPDIMIECSGQVSVFAENLDIIASPGKYLLLGQTSTREVAIRPNTVQDKNLVVIGSKSGDIRHYIKCLKFVEANRERYPFGDIISHVYPLAEINQALADMRAGSELKAAVRPS